MSTAGQMKVCSKHEGLAVFALFALFALIRCGNFQTGPDPDSLTLNSASEQAKQIAAQQIPQPVLRQLETDLVSVTFLFTNKEGTMEVDVTAPGPNVPSRNWSSNALSVSPLLGHPESDMRVADLRIGPGRVATSMTTHWPGCHPRGLILYRDDGTDDLVWVGSCDTSLGMVSGQMFNRPGVFQPFNSPPASMPATATPLP